MTGQEEELIINLSIIGGIGLAGLLVSIALIGIVILYRSKMKRKNIEKEMFNQKQRSNGRDKH